MKSVVILLAHGTREAAASKPVFDYARALAEKTGLRVEPCMREFIEPSVPTVVGALAKEGVDEITVVPFFLFKSGHVTRDITADLAAEKVKHPHLAFRVAEAIGFDPLVVEILEQRLKAVTA